MSAKAVYGFFAQALLIQCALSQCISRTTFPGFGPDGWAIPALPAPSSIAPALTYEGLATGWLGNSLAYDGLAANWAGNSLAYDGICAPTVEISAASGGALPVSSASTVSPVGIVLESENIYEGALAVARELPFIGTVDMEGVLPLASSGAVKHACGNGVTRMVSQNVGPSSSADISVSPGAFTPGVSTSGAAVIPANLYGQSIRVYSPAASIGSATGATAPTAFLASAIPLGYHGGLPSLAGLGYSAANWAGIYPAVGYNVGNGPYGGAGEGNVGVAGELPVSGNTAIAGQVPILGAVSFSGQVPAAGTVTIIGKCTCDPVISYLY